MPKYSPLTRFALDGQVVEKQKDYVEKRSLQLKVPAEKYREAVKASFADEWEAPSGMSKADEKQFKALMKAAQVDFNKANELREAAKAEKEKAEQEKKAQKAKEQEAADAQAKQGQEAFAKASQKSTALAKPMDQLLAQAVARAFQGNVSIEEDGKLALAEGVDPLIAIATSFANLKTLHDKSLDLETGFAAYEAKLGLLAKEHLGENWPNVFPSAEANDVARIKKGMKAIEEAEELGLDITTTPLSTVRAILEARYSQDEAKNKELKQKAFETYLEKSEEAGKPLPQTAAKKLVREVAEARTAGAGKIPRHDYIYVRRKGDVVGSSMFIVEFFNQSMAVITADSQMVSKVDEDGDPVLVPIPLVGAVERGETESTPKPVLVKKKAKKAEEAPVEPTEPTEPKEEEGVIDFFGDSETPESESEVIAV